MSLGALSMDLGSAAVDLLMELGGIASKSEENSSLPCSFRGRSCLKSCNR
jgi:hypothetical protein